MKNETQFEMKSAVGSIYLVATEYGLSGAFWRKPNVSAVTSLKGSGKPFAILRQAVKELEEYFAGKRREFTVPLDVSGTEFQKAVWKQLSKIPYGETCSYSDIAKRVKNERAVRAVGSANGRNPISIIVPCHRVIASSGKLGGYAGGLGVKSKLLDLERA